MKLNLGCGKDYRDGWINVDIDKNRKADVYCDLTLSLPFKLESTSYILLNHVLEHLTFTEGLYLLLDLHRTLDQNGTLEIAVPDLATAIRDYIYGKSSLEAPAIQRIYGNQLTPYEVHKSGYSKNSLKEVLTACKFTITEDLSTEAEIRFKCKRPLLKLPY